MNGGGHSHHASHHGMDHGEGKASDSTDKDNGMAGMDHKGMNMGGGSDYSPSSSDTTSGQTKGPASSPVRGKTYLKFVRVQYLMLLVFSLQLRQVLMQTGKRQWKLFRRSAKLEA